MVVFGISMGLQFQVLMVAIQARRRSRISAPQPV